jgi:hypothetical protein
VTFYAAQKGKSLIGYKENSSIIFPRFRCPGTWGKTLYFGSNRVIRGAVVSRTDIGENIEANFPRSNFRSLPLVVGETCKHQKDTRSRQISDRYSARPSQSSKRWTISVAANCYRTCSRHSTTTVLPVALGAHHTSHGSTIVLMPCLSEQRPTICELSNACADTYICFSVKFSIPTILM